MTPIIRTFICCGILLSGMTGLQAQERAAGGTTETQMTWSALKSQVDTARAESTAAHTRIDKIQVCSKKQMIYVPNAAGADADDCIHNTKIENVITCGKTGMVYNGTKCVDPEAETIACGKKKQFYNGKDCVDMTEPVCTMKFTTASNGMASHSGCQGGQPCPDGYVTMPGGGGGGGDRTGSGCGSKTCAKVTCN